MNIKEERKQKLLEEKKKLEEEIQKHKQPIDFGGDVDGFDEETNESEETTNQLALLEMFKERLRGVEKALEEIKNEN